MKVHCAHDKIISIDKLKPHPKNNNKHPDDQIKRLAKILNYQGWRYPIKVSKQSGFITSGHARLEAAKLNGWKKVPVNIQEYESDEQEYADITSDNAIASWAELDFSSINAEIGELGPDFDIELLGMKDFEIDVADKEGECDEDEVPEPKESITKLGDLWILGEHRLLCGDSTDILQVEKLMNGEKADMVFTSPPYNQGGKKGGSKLSNKGLYSNQEMDNKNSEEYIQFNLDVISNIKQSDSLTICLNICYNKKSPWEYIEIVSRINKIFPLKESVVWDKKQSINPGGSNLSRRAEFIFVFGNSEMQKHQYDYECNLWAISSRNSSSNNHKACFPVGLPEKGISLFSMLGQIVYDPFGGSGSTLIACEKTNRKCFMMELDPHYCDVIVARWEKFTGQKAVLDGRG